MPEKCIQIYCMMSVECDSYVNLIKALNVQGSIPGKGKRFFALHSVQTSAGAHPASSPMGTGGSSAEELYLHSLMLLHGVVLN
jgi:hypothetical protein